LSLLRRRLSKTIEWELYCYLLPLLLLLLLLLPPYLLLQLWLLLNGWDLWLCALMLA
jgi:hypothetical protein